MYKRMRTIVNRRILPYVLWLATFACGPANSVNPHLNDTMPQKIIWAWERPEDLRFLDPHEYAVAALTQTIYLEKDSVTPHKRRQPLDVAPGSYIIAVTRIETNKDGHKRPTFDDSMVKRTVDLIQNSSELPNIRAIQLDFDAVVSERPFYRRLIFALRQALDDRTGKDNRMPLTMTSLSSWCTGDAWFNDFPVDEAVPMVFEMGADSQKIRNYLRNGNDWKEPLCRGSYGISVNESNIEGIKPFRRLYFFSDSPWTKDRIL